MATNNPYAIENFVTFGWRGYFPLFQAFWRYYLVGRVLAAIVAISLISYLGFIGWFFGVLVWAPYWIWSFGTMWQCAFNTDVPLIGYIVRTLLFFEAVYIVFNPSIVTMVI